METPQSLGPLKATNSLNYNGDFILDQGLEGLVAAIVLDELQPNGMLSRDKPRELKRFVHILTR